MTHARVWINGAERTGSTIAELSIAGGRSDKLSQPEMANVGLRIAWRDTEPLPTYGAKVAVLGRPRDDFTWSTHARAMFYGRATDVSWERDETGQAWVSLVAVDPVRNLDGLMIGDTPWPIAGMATRLRDHIWAAARTALGNPLWMTNYYSNLSLNEQLALVAARDVDRQDALKLYYDVLSVVQGALFYIPHETDGNFTGAVAPTDPAQWVPTAFTRSGFALYAPPNGARGRVPSSAIVAAPRRWQSVSSIVNRVKITGRDRNDPDASPDRLGVVTASINSYGPRAATVNTDLLNETIPASGGADSLQWMADRAVERSAYPTWDTDRVTVVIDAATATGDINLIWPLTAFGPGACAVAVDIAGVPSSLAAAAPYWRWVIEEQEWIWTPEGWDFVLTLSDPVRYTGGTPLDDWRPLTRGGDA